MEIRSSVGLGPPGLEHRREMMLGFEFDLDGLQHLVVGQRAHRQRQHGAGPAVEAVDLGAVESELLGDDDAGQRHREIEVELALAPLDQPVDQAAGDVVDVVGHVGDATREERLRDEPAIVGVDGRVGALQRLDVTPTAFTENLLVPPGIVDLQTLLRAAAAATAREQFRVGEHESDVVVSGDHHGADLGHREDRTLFVELGVEVPRVVLDRGIEHRVIDGTCECADAVLECELCHGRTFFQATNADLGAGHRDPRRLITKEDSLTSSDLRHRWECDVDDRRLLQLLLKATAPTSLTPESSTRTMFSPPSPDIHSALLASDLANAVPVAELETLDRLATTIWLDAGEQIVAKNGFGRECFVVIDGEFKVERDDLSRSSSAPAASSARWRC